MFLLYFELKDILMFLALITPGMFLIYKGYKNGRYALAGCTYILSLITCCSLFGKPNLYNGWAFTLFAAWFVFYLSYSLIAIVIESREISGKQKKIEYKKLLRD